MEPEILHGGVANRGAVVRVGGEVLRPSGPQTPAVHALLAHCHAVGFDGVPKPLGLTDDGRERLEFIPGDVPVPPFPAWSQTDAALASTAALLRRYHDAVAGFVPPVDAIWARDLADPDAPSDDRAIVCHNDVCPENVVYRAGEAVAILDFDYAAPGRPVYDLAQLARMCVPIDTSEDAARFGRGGLDAFSRLRLVADAYGLAPDRHAFFETIEGTIARGGTFVQAKVDAGDEAFIEMWNTMGGAARFQRRREWVAANRQRFLDSLG